MSLVTIPLDVYFIAFPKDSAYLKSVVGITYILEVVQTIMATRDAFRQYATGWGNLTELNDIGWLWFTVPVLDGISMLFVRLPSLTDV